MEEEIKRGFFKNIWTSIRDFEKYEVFAADKALNTIKYILLLTLIFVIGVSTVYTYKFHLGIQDVKKYVEQNIEEISLIDGKLDIKTDNSIIIEDEEQAIPLIIINTSENANKEELLGKTNKYDNGIILLSDRIIISSNFLAQNENIYYSNLVDENINNKEEFVKFFSDSNMLNTYIIFFVTVFIYLFIVYLSSNMVDGIVLGALGYIFARIVKLRLKFRATFNIGLHALTLPMTLNLIYIIVNTITGFNITYFQWMYTTISYIYVAVKNGSSYIYVVLLDN